MLVDHVVVVYVKACNIQTASEFTLGGPKGQVLAMVVGNDILFAGAEVVYPYSGLWLSSFLFQASFFFFGSNCLSRILSDFLNSYFLSSVNLHNI